MKAKNKIWIATLSGLVFFIFDRILKYLFFHQILDNGFLITYTQNTGLVFGLPTPKVFLILFYILITILILILVLWLINFFQNKKFFKAGLVWFILLGAASNLLDRIKFGFVIDYIDLKIWPVFNLADMMIVGGIILLITKTLKHKKHKNI